MAKALQVQVQAPKVGKKRKKIQGRTKIKEMTKLLEVVVAMEPNKELQLKVEMIKADRRKVQALPRVTAPALVQLHLKARRKRSERSRSGATNPESR